MAVVSPWPATPAALGNARALLRESVSLYADTDPKAIADSVWDRLGAAAAALVERHAPGAPQAIRNEAVIRCAGYLAGSDPAYSRSGVEAGNFKADLARSGVSALRHSGAMALLSPWTVRRAGRIAEAD